MHIHKVDQTVKDLDKSSQWVTTVRKTAYGAWAEWVGVYIGH